MTKVVFRQQGAIAFIKINRPERLNCFDYDTLVQLQSIIEDVKLENNIRAVIITGAGEKAFSAGADLKERYSLTEKELRRNVSKIRDVFTMIEDLPQPTIAAMNGYALGGGLELALACDFRYAVEGAVLGLTEVSWGIIPGAGGTQRLSRLIGISKAKELILTARKIKAEEAYQLGIVNKVVKREQLMNSCAELVEEITRNAPLAVAQAKYAINYGAAADMKTGLAIESKAYEVIIPTSDRLEALAAFREKRTPKFRGQ